jgi:hypothetical protein
VEGSARKLLQNNFSGLVTAHWAITHHFEEPSLAESSNLKQLQQLGAASMNREGIVSGGEERLKAASAFADGRV